MPILHYRATAIIAAMLLLWGCDDEQPTVQQAENKEEIAAKTWQAISGSNENVWRIAQARLFNAAATSGIDISSAFNVKDDEFEFILPDADQRADLLQQEGVLIWRQGYSIHAGAASAEQALQDHYFSPRSFSFGLSADDPNMIMSQAGDFSLAPAGDNKLEGEIKLGDGQRLMVSLVPKTAEDYKRAPASLSFRPLSTIRSYYISQAPGLIGSNSQNSLYLGHKEYVEEVQPNLTVTRIESEKIIKFNLSTQEQVVKTIPHQDMNTKELQIVDNKLIVIGGAYANTYPMNLAAAPESASHGLSLSRHGSTTLNNEVYIIGGGHRDVNSDKVYRWNNASNSLEEFATMPAPRVWADGEIVNNKLYIFGGQTTFSDAPAESTIFIYDLEAKSWETLELPEAINITYAVRHQNLIYLAGRIDRDMNNDDNVEKFDTAFGVFDTRTNSYQELTASLEFPHSYSTIAQLAIVNDKLYVIHGLFNGINEEFTIQVADL